MTPNASAVARIGAKLKGLIVSHAAADGAQCLALHFVDGTILRIKSAAGTLVANIAPATAAQSAPTQRQRDYLGFIEKYIARFGRAPAESDIGRHFLISAPTVNQMMRTLERRGFISRKPGVARSIKIHAQADAAPGLPAAPATRAVPMPGESSVRRSRL